MNVLSAGLVFENRLGRPTARTPGSAGGSLGFRGRAGPSAAGANRVEQRQPCPAQPDRSARRDRHRWMPERQVDGEPVTGSASDRRLGVQSSKRWTAPALLEAPGLHRDYVPADIARISAAEEEADARRTVPGSVVPRTDPSPFPDRWDQMRARTRCPS